MSKQSTSFNKEGIARVTLKASLENFEEVKAQLDEICDKLGDLRVNVTVSGDEEGEIKTFKEKERELKDSLPCSQELIRECKVSDNVINEIIPDVIKEIKRNTSKGKLVTEKLVADHLTDIDRLYLKRFFGDAGYMVKFKAELGRQGTNIIFNYIVVEAR